MVPERNYARKISKKQKRPQERKFEANSQMGRREVENQIKMTHELSGKRCNFARKAGRLGDE